MLNRQCSSTRQRQQGARRPFAAGSRCAAPRVIQRQRSSRQHYQGVFALGFDFGDSDPPGECVHGVSGQGPVLRAGQPPTPTRLLSKPSSTTASAPSRAAPSPKAFAAFTLKANSLLVYQGVMRGAVGEALLALMAQSQKYQVCVLHAAGPYSIPQQQQQQQRRHIILVFMTGCSQPSRPTLTPLPPPFPPGVQQGHHCLLRQVLQPADDEWLR